MALPASTPLSRNQAWKRSARQSSSASMVAVILHKTNAKNKGPGRSPCWTPDSDRWPNGCHRRGWELYPWKEFWEMNGIHPAVPAWTQRCRHCACPPSPQQNYHLPSACSKAMNYLFSSQGAGNSKLKRLEEFNGLLFSKGMQALPCQPPQDFPTAMGLIS